MGEWNSDGVSPTLCDLSRAYELCFGPRDREYRVYGKRGGYYILAIDDAGGVEVASAPSEEVARMLAGALELIKRQPPQGRIY
jgi:hypothetical protein